MPTDTQAGDRKREEAVLQQLIAMVEGFTHFDRSQFQDIVTTTERVAVTAYQSYRATFHIVEDTDAGELTSDVIDVGSAAGTWQRVNQEMSTARLALPLRLEYWLERHADNLLDALQPSDCFQISHPVGYEYHCQNCQGAGSLTCSNCSGQGKLTCYGCHGATRITCSHCNGGWQTCSRCGGTGGWMETRSRTISTGTHGDQVTTTEYYQEWVTCPGCSGARTMRCMTCGGAGVVTCGTCSGSGIVLCTYCGASGKVSCGPCRTTGWLHEWRQLQASVTTTFSVSSATANAEARQTIAGRNSPTEFLAFARDVAYNDHRSDEDTIERTFQGFVDVVTLSFRTAGFSEKILGYGTPPQIFDYKNVISRLLQGTLDEMEQALRSTPRYLPWLPPHLNRTLTPFLQSETNQQIGKRAAGGYDDAAKIATRDFRQSVSADYVERAINAIHGSIERVYWSSILPGVAFLFLAPTLVLVIADERGWINFGPIPALVVGVIGIAVALALEQYGKWQLHHRFKPAFKSAVDDLLDDTKILRRGAKLTRWTAVIGALLGWIGGAMILAAIFTTNDHARQELQKKRAVHSSPSTRTTHKPAIKRKK